MQRDVPQGQKGNNDQQNIKQKTEDRLTRNTLKTEGELRFCRGECSAIV